MNLNIFIIGLIVILSFKFSLAQNELLSCSYSGSPYTCTLTIYNPNGLNNFQNINGTHATGKTDDDVLWVVRATSSNTTNIPSIICTKFKNAQRIDFQTIGIQRVDEDSFKNCTKLTYIELRYNKITQVHEKAFLQNSNLLHLYLWDNLIPAISENLFTNLEKLRTLTLCRNRFQDFPTNIFKPLVNLIEFHLETNQITALKPEWFETLEKVTYLDLHENLVEELPRNVFSFMTNLATLYLFSNKLKIINSNSFSSHPYLTNVYIYTNQIDAIDEKFINNTAVSYLDARNNVCVSKSITDNTVARESMRAELQKCFENFDTIMAETTTTTTSSPGCGIGNLNERVCKLEEDNEEFREYFEELREEDARLGLITDELESEVKELIDEKDELRKIIEAQQEQIKSLEAKDKVIISSLEYLEEKILELTTYPCACK